VFLRLRRPPAIGSRAPWHVLAAPSYLPAEMALTHEESVDALELLFSIGSLDEYRRAFLDHPPLTDPEVGRLLQAAFDDADVEAKRAARARFELWDLGMRGEFESGWSGYERAAAEFFEAVFIPRFDELRAKAQQYSEAEEWQELAAAGGEILDLAGSGGPDEAKYEGLRAIAQGAFHDRSVDRADALETAILSWNQILSILDRRPDLDTEDTRSTALMNLGTALGARLKGDPRRNQERAIAAQRAALKLISRHKTPDAWAMARTNLGLSLLQHAREILPPNESLGLPHPNAVAKAAADKASAEVEEAISHFEAALSWRSAERNPSDWAYTEVNLGLAYSRRRVGQREGNLRKALTHFDNGARGFELANQPTFQAVAIHDLASESLTLAQLEQTDQDEAVLLRERAGEYAEQAIAIASSLGDSAEIGRYWAALGDICAASGNEQSALDAFGHALELLTPSNDARRCREAARSLAQLTIDLGDWPAAADAWEVAAQAAIAVADERSTRADRFIELEQNQNIHRWAAYAAIRADRPRRAIEILEQGRGRELRDLMHQDSPELTNLASLHPDLALDYRNARELLTELEHSDLDDERSEDVALASEHLAVTVAAIREQAGFESFLQPKPFDEVVQVVESDDDALVYLVTAPQGSAALIVTSDGEVTAIKIGELTSTEAYRIFLEVDFDTEALGGYFIALETGAHLDDALLLADQLIGEMMLKPLEVELADRGLRSLCLIPVGLLGLLPLHALTWQDNTKTRSLIDDFIVRYAPSAGVLATTQRRHEERSGSLGEALIVGNPLPSSQPLEFAEVEAASVAAALDVPATTLIGPMATKAAVSAAFESASLVHLACHGVASPHDQALESALFLAGDEPWTAREMLAGRGTRANLVVASACETSIIQGYATADEVLSLATVFLGCGAAAVIASLWAVNDFATAVLMSRFYEVMCDSDRTDRNPAAALRDAQLWLRDLSHEEAVGYVADRSALRSHSRAPASDTEEYARPFAARTFWAAFVHYGA
jgi:CHAT domain-containing protein